MARKIIGSHKNASSNEQHAMYFNGNVIYKLTTCNFFTLFGHVRTYEKQRK